MVVHQNRSDTRLNFYLELHLQWGGYGEQVTVGIGIPNCLAAKGIDHVWSQMPRFTRLGAPRVRWFSGLQQAARISIFFFFSPNFHLKLVLRCCTLQFATGSCLHPVCPFSYAFETEKNRVRGPRKTPVQDKEHPKLKPKTPQRDYSGFLTM